MLLCAAEARWAAASGAGGDSCIRCTASASDASPLGGSAGGISMLIRVAVVTSIGAGGLSACSMTGQPGSSWLDALLASRPPSPVAV